MFSFKLSYPRWRSLERREHFSSLALPLPQCPQLDIIKQSLLMRLNSVYASEVLPVSTAAGGWLLDEAEQGGPTLHGIRAEGGPPGEMLQAEAWLRAPRGVIGVGEVGQRCEKGQGGVRWRGGGMQG